MNPSLEIREAGRPAPGLGGRVGRSCRQAFVIAALLALVSAGSVAMLAAGLVTAFQARRLYREVIGRGLARVALWVCGVRLIMHRDGPWPAGQVVYVSNHTSALDVLVLAALGLPNTRFFLSGFLRQLVPFGVMGYLAGTFWTVAQSRPEKRVQIFQRAERVLRRTGESVYLSPEGVRIPTGEIGHFNKGAFHLATALGAPLVPLYLATPRPGKPDGQPFDPEGYLRMGMVKKIQDYVGDVHPCLVQAYLLPAISTAGWNIDELERNRRQVRDYFVSLHAELKPSP